MSETCYFVARGADWERARRLLDGKGIVYRVERWQPGVVAVYVAADVDVSGVFAMSGSRWPEVVALWGCPATRSADGSSCLIAGLYEVVEFHRTEPSAYVWSPCVDLLPVGSDGDDWEGQLVTVDLGDFEERVDPAGWGRQLVLEREMEMAG